jgi:hypothetical protein
MVGVLRLLPKRRRHVKVEFQHKTFVILGQVAMGKRDAWKKIQELGGNVSSTPRPSSDYIVIGTRPGTKKLALVDKVGKPVLTEDEFMAAIEAAETGREAGQEDVDLDDALAAFRELLNETPGRDMWVQLQELLEQCNPAQLDVIVDYVEQHISQWPNGDEHPDAPWPLAYEDVPSEIRVFSAAWRKRAVNGERSPLLRLGRSLDLSDMELRGADAMPLLTHPDLVNLRCLNLGSTNILDASFYEGLRLTEQLPHLRTLVLHQLSEETAAALCGEHRFAQLRQMVIAPLSVHHFAQGAKEVYEQLFQAEWWAQIEGLFCCTGKMYSHYGFQRSVYPQLAEHAHRMKKLRHLAMEDTNQVEALLETDLFLQVRRLSMSLSAVEPGLLVLEHLEARRDSHTVETLDLSRGVFLGAHRRPKKYAKAPQKGLVETLICHTDWGALRKVVVESSLLGKRMNKALLAWGEETGISVVFSPWKA